MDSQMNSGLESRLVNKMIAFLKCNKDAKVVFAGRQLRGLHAINDISFFILDNVQALKGRGIQGLKYTMQL